MLVILTTAFGYPTTFLKGQRRKQLNNTFVADDDYGWYAPMAMILTPLSPESGGLVKHQLGSRFPADGNIPLSWSPDPWAHRLQQPPAYHYGR